MKRIVGLLILLFGIFTHVMSVNHPNIVVNNDERCSIRYRIKNNEWARKSFYALKDNIELFADRHKSNPEWIISRLAMYWKDGERYTQCYLKNQNWNRGEGNATVPTVRMPGMRTWNKYVNVPLEERTPYNETGDMWGISRINPQAPKVLVQYKETGHMIRSNNVEILTLAEEAAFIYWVTEEEKYARFASDIFYTWLLGTYYMNPVLDLEQSTGGKGGYEPGGICGYYDYEQIHDDLAMHAAMIYDLAFDYLKKNPHVHLNKIEKELEEVVGIVFKRFIDIGFVRGGKSGNWNVNGWNIMLKPILALEDNDFYSDGKGRSFYLHYLVKESTPYHDAIPDILKGYDGITGLWPESPGYAFGVTGILLDFATLLRRQGIDIITDNPLLRKTAMAVFPWMDSNANMIVFGDTRGGTANFRTFENLLSYYTDMGDHDNINRVASALNKGVGTGKYNRNNAGWSDICLFVPDIPDVRDAAKERMSYSRFHRLVTMRNGPADNELMAILYGGRNGSHLSPNGLALQLYGFGYALSPDASGYESYWSKDHTYHQSVTGSNTIMPGYTEGDIVVNALEPYVDSLSFVNEAALNPNINVADVSAGDKRRVVVLMKTDKNNGYYVDIFRSDTNDSDYLFHNVGKSVSLYRDDNSMLELIKTDSITNHWHKGYDFFKNPYMAELDDNFKAVWNVTTGENNIKMNMWMPYEKGRYIYKVDAPYTTLNKGITPDNVSSSPDITPTIIVRQSGNNAWKNPYIAVFEPTRNNKYSVTDVEKVRMISGKAVGICVKSKGSRTDYILSNTDYETECATDDNLKMEGAFVSVTEEERNITQILLLNGKSLVKGDVLIKSDEPISVSIYLKNNEWYYSSTGKAYICIDNKKYVVEKASDKLLKL